MTEVPDYLLERSRARRAAITGGGDGDGDSGGGDSGGAESSAAPATTQAATPAPSMPAHPAPAEEPPPPPPSPMVEAYNKRRKIPWWATPVLAAIPVWAYIFVGTLEPPPAGDGPLVLGEEIYAGSGCAGCHGGGGGGGVGPAFTNGAIYETFPSFEEQVEWIRLGSDGWQAEVGDTYGATDKPVNGGMPGFGDSLSDAELVYVTLHEREALGGENPDEAEMLRLEILAEYFVENPDATIEDAITALEDQGAFEAAAE